MISKLPITVTATTVTLGSVTQAQTVPLSSDQFLLFNNVAWQNPEIPTIIMKFKQTLLRSRKFKVI